MTIDFSFKEFMNINKMGIKTGEIVIDNKPGVDPLSDFDYAVQYAIGLILEEKGETPTPDNPVNITLDEICDKINIFAPELLEDET